MPDDEDHALQLGDGHGDEHGGGGSLAGTRLVARRRPIVVGFPPC